MYELPFDVKLTDGLVQWLRTYTGECHRDEPDFLPSINWCAYSSGPRAGTWGWSVHWLSRRFMRFEDIFGVAELEICFPEQERQRAAGHTLDLVDGEIVER